MIDATNTMSQLIHEIGTPLELLDELSENEFSAVSTMIKGFVAINENTNVEDIKLSCMSMVYLVIKTQRENKKLKKDIEKLDKAHQAVITMFLKGSE